MLAVYIYIYIYIYVHVYAYVCVRGRLCHPPSAVLPGLSCAGIATTVDWDSPLPMDGLMALLGVNSFVVDCAEFEVVSRHNASSRHILIALW